MATSGFGPGGLSPRARSLEKVSLSGIVRVETIYEDGQSAILVKESTDDKLRRKDIGTLILMELSALLIPEKRVIKNLFDELRLDETIYAEAEPCAKTFVDQEYTFKALRASKIFVGKGTIKELRKGYGYLRSTEYGNIFFPGASVTEDFGGLHDLSLTLRPGDEVRFTAWHQPPNKLTKPSANCQYKAVEVSVFEMYSFEEDLPNLGFVAVYYQKACILYCKPIGSVHMNYDNVRSKTKPSEITLGMRFKFRYSRVPNQSRILGCRYKVEEAELWDVPLRTFKNENEPFRSFTSADSTGFAKSNSATGFGIARTGSETSFPLSDRPTGRAAGGPPETSFPLSDRPIGQAASGPPKTSFPLSDRPTGRPPGSETPTEATVDAIFVTAETGSETDFPISSRLGGGAERVGLPGGEATAEASVDAVDANLRKLATEDWVADIEAELDWDTEDEEDTGITIKDIPTALSTDRTPNDQIDLSVSEIPPTSLHSGPKTPLANSRLDYHTPSPVAGNHPTTSPCLPPGLGESSDQVSRSQETFPRVENSLNSRWNANVATARRVDRNNTAASFNRASPFSTAQVPPFGTGHMPAISAAQVPPVSTAQTSQPQQALVRPFTSPLLTNNEYNDTVTSRRNGNFIPTLQYDHSPLQYSRQNTEPEVLPECRESTCINAVDSGAQTENELDEVLMMSRLIGDTEICALMCHKYPMLMAEYLSSIRPKPNNN